MKIQARLRGMRARRELASSFTSAVVGVAKDNLVAGGKGSSPAEYLAAAKVAAAKEPLRKARQRVAAEARAAVAMQARGRGQHPQPYPWRGSPYYPSPQTLPTAGARAWAASSEGSRPPPQLRGTRDGAGGHGRAF